MRRCVVVALSRPRVPWGVPLRRMASKSFFEEVDEQVAGGVAWAGQAVKGAAGLGAQAAAAAGAASRVVVEHVGAAAAAAVPETGLDVPEGVRSAATAVRGAAQVGQEALAGLAGAAGTVGRAAGAAAGSAARAAMGDLLGGGGPSWRSVEAAKTAASEAGGAASRFLDVCERERAATMEAARGQVRRVLAPAAGPNAAAAADELLRAAQEASDLASKTAAGVAKEAAKAAAKEAAKGAVQGKD